MGPKSRLEIDFQRLLYKVESDMSANNPLMSPQSWRLEKVRMLVLKEYEAKRDNFYSSILKHLKINCQN